MPLSSNAEDKELIAMSPRSIGLADAAGMQIAPEQGEFLTLLTSLVGARSAVEVGTFTGVADPIYLRVAPAIDTLRALPGDRSIDLAFIDADKTGCVDYYEELLARLSAGGLICVDNTLWSGAVVDAAVDDSDTVAIRRFNDHVAGDPRYSP
jgi:caffeoyl-CoA O-methyltransferase